MKVVGQGIPNHSHRLLRFVRTRRLFTLTLLLVGSVAAAADPEPVSVTMGADRSQLEPGGTMLLGARLEIEPGWHVYWKNPGDAGLATAVDLRLAQGFETGPLLWPVPIGFSQPGEIAGYGYEGSVLLLREVWTPASFSQSTVQTIRAEVSWLACKDVCVLGEATVEEGLPLASAHLLSAEALGRWRTTLPVDSSSGKAPFSLTVSPGAVPGPRTLWLQWAAQPNEFEFFPDPGEGLRVSDVKVRSRGGLTRIDLSVGRAGEPTHLTPVLQSLVVVTDAAGRRRGYQLPINLS